jgi:hypothetical protein
VEGGPVVWDRWGMKRIVVLALMAGCATSYQSATSHQAIGGGAYLITASGNGWTGSSTVEQYKYRRATELCPGGFDVIDANQSMRTSVTTFDSGKTYQTINRPSGSLAIRCKQAPAANAGAGGFWCSTRAELGICYVQPGDCEVRRRELLRREVCGRVRTVRAVHILGGRDLRAERLLHVARSVR